MGFRRKRFRGVLLVMLCLLLAAFAEITAETGSSLSSSEESQRPAFLNQMVTLSLDRSSIADVVRLLARQYDFNLAVSGEVKGEVSMMLKDVTLADALDAILFPNKMTWYVHNGLLIVKPAGFLSPDERSTIIVHLDHATPQQAVTAAQNILSPDGKIEVLAAEETQSDQKPKATAVVVSDRTDLVRQIAQLIAELDRPKPLVNIAVKLVETTLSKDNKLGIDWPSSYQFLLGSLPGSTSGGSTSTGTPTGALHKSLSRGGWTWGTFTAGDIQTALDLLLQTGHSKLLSDPNLTTESNKPAEIEVSTTIPIETLNRFTEGAVLQDIVSFQDLDIGIKLKVLARVTDSNFISMDVNPVIEEITGFTGPADNQRPITSNRSVKTTVRVRDGETLVIGGLLKDSEFKIIRKLPLLGNIPLVGRAFQHHSSQVERTDLTVFITPTIVSNE